MGVRSRSILVILALLAFLAACGFVMRRRAEKEDRQQAASLQYLYKRDRVFQETEALVGAAYQGDLNRIRKFLPDAIKAEIPNIVNTAGRAGQTAVVEYLFDQGYLPDRLGNGPYLLTVAASYGYTDLADLVLRRDASLTATDHQEALMWAVAMGQADMVRLLLKVGANPDSPAGSQPVPDYGGLTPLMVAANYGHTDVVRLLLQRQVNVNRKSPFGRTALTYARSHDLRMPLPPGSANTNKVLPQRAAARKMRIDRTDDPAAVVTLLRKAGGME